MAKHPSSPPKPPQDAPAPASYEEALAELDALVGAMERGEMPLDRLIDSYRRGAELLGFCRGRLEAIDAQVKVLEDGQLKPWITTAS
jgi:exodeoxyribonuclease VII small subunit